MVSLINIQAQTYTLPTVLVDSMIWEVQKGRACDTALNFALQSIEAKNVLIDGQGKLIELRGRQIATLTELDQTWQMRMDNQADLFFIEKSKLKQQKRKWLKIALSEAGLIALLLAVFLSQ